LQTREVDKNFRKLFTEQHARVLGLKDTFLQQENQKFSLNSFKELNEKKKNFFSFFNKLLFLHFKNFNITDSSYKSFFFKNKFLKKNLRTLITKNNF
jgi:hypothetical protein